MHKVKKNIFIPGFFLCFIALLVACKSSQKLSDNSGANQLSAQSEIQFNTLFIDGCSERMKGNFTEAKKKFEDCLKIDPKNIAVNYELAMIYKMLGSSNEALINAKLCASADSKNEWYQILLAECYVSNKQYQQSIKVREQLIKNFPKRNEFKEELAFEYSLIGQNDKALNIYNELENNLGISEQITLNKLRILKNQRNYKLAEEELLKLLNTDKSQIRFYNYLAELYSEVRELDKAKLIYDKIIELDPKNPTIYLAMHDYHVAKGNETEAFQDLLKAVQNPLLEVLSISQIIEDYYARADRGNHVSFEQGLILVKAALKEHGAASNLNALCGDFYKLDRNLKEASVYYYKAAIVDKGNYKVWQNLLIADNELKLNDSLAKHSAAASEMFPNQPVFYLYNGIANTALKKYSQASTSFQDGLSLAIGNKRLMIDFLSAAGDNYYLMKEFEKSDKSFEEALKLDADNTYVLNNYAYYLSLRNFNIETAEKLSRRANELKPNNANYMDTYAWIFFQQKKYSQALEWLNNAVKLSQSPTLIEHLGDALFQMNKPEEALKEWIRAKDLGNKSDKLLKKIKDKKWYE